MTTTLPDIVYCVKSELEEFEKRLLFCFKDEPLILGSFLECLLAKKGKRIRPLLTFLTANICGKVTEATYRSALILENLHAASLVHDDVLDQSDIRRGGQTINSLWGNNNAILLGDYLYGKCLGQIETQEDFNLMPVYARIGMSLPKGELYQKYACENQDTSKQSYFSVIYNKTASLFEASVEIGVLTSGCGDKIKSMKQLGYNLGIAFQIKDDVLDFNDQSFSEKPVGNDICEKKITLPLIYLLEKVSAKEKQEILSFIFQDDKSKEDVQSLMNIVIAQGCLEEAQAEVIKFSDLAKKQLEVEKESIYKTSLLDLIDFLANRKM
jgi:octaprenyl-diphosphate synthase